MTRSRQASVGPVALPASAGLAGAGRPGSVRSGLRRYALPAHGVHVAVLIGVAVLLAWLLRAIGDQPVVFDADGYVAHARILASGTLEGWGFRTYGYPAFLVPWVVLAGPDLDRLRWCVFLAQVAVHVAAGWVFARRVAGAFGHAGSGRLTFALVALNPFLLIMTGQVLSDLLSAALIAIGVGLLLPTRDDRPAIVGCDGMLGPFAIALSVEVRPAAAIALLTVRGWARAGAWRRATASWAGAVLTVGVCAWLSVWMQAQAPSLVATRAIVQTPDPFLPVASFDATPPDRWIADQRQTFTVLATNLVERAWSAQAPGKVFLHIMFVGPDGAATVDTRVEVRQPIDRDIQSGGQLAMRAMVTAPSVGGVYRLRQQLELDEQAGLVTGLPFETLVTVNQRRDGRR